MAIKVKFFASLREKVSHSMKEIDATGVATVRDVWASATDTETMPRDVLCSINLEHQDPSAAVKDGDEVAFFPPVTGG